MKLGVQVGHSSGLQLASHLLQAAENACKGDCPGPHVYSKHSVSGSAAQCN
jgi:hypothetical protein